MSSLARSRGEVGFDGVLDDLEQAERKGLQARGTEETSHGWEAAGGAGRRGW